MERSLLAATQQRLGPNHQSLFGFLVFVFDGIKLFSKQIFSATNISVFFTSWILLLIPLVLDSQLSRSYLAISFQIQFSLIFVLGILEVSSFLAFTAVQNSYVTLGINRLIEITVCLELTFSLLEVLGFGFCSFHKTSFFLNNSILIFTVVTFCFLLCDFGKVPFDVVEAESELIDG